MARLFWKNIAAIIAALISVVSSFFGIKKKDKAGDITLKISGIAFRWSSYYLIDWGIFILMGLIAVVLKSYNTPGKAIFIILWIIEIAIAGSFVIIYKETKIDITMGEAFRNSVDTLWLKSKIAGVIAIIVLALKFLLWDGSERALMFLDKETPTLLKKTILIVVVAGIKMAVWTKLYLLGYDTVGKFIRSL